MGREDQSPNSPNRRTFLQTTTGLAGAALLPSAAGASSDVPSPASKREKSNRLPREVWIATISQGRLQARDPRDMIEKVLAKMAEMASSQPDVICLPEIFPFTNISSRAAAKEVAEEPIGETAAPFANFAREHNCYVVCPIYTKDDGGIYNATVFIDRQGQVLGEYRKAHPTVDEMKAGVSPGPLDPPVFNTDFGTIGAQICFDIQWTDGWQALQQAGAEIVFWPSAFAGGAMVNAKAWQHKYVVVSSTNKDTAKICDISGEEVGRTSRWNDWVCAPVNLEKAFLHTWPYVRRFPEIQAKYGRKISIRTFPEEEWTIIESRSPELRVADVMDEFELKSHEAHIGLADAAQRQRR